ncbi:MAG TPA: hypothetical protein VNM90_25025 [Haliangium sp.]|nr:hypothetical protein [Haliangium sp.]
MSEKDKDTTRKVMHAATAWHPPFYDLMTEGAPPSTKIRTEVVLSQQPRRADLLLLRRRDMPPRDDEARVLRGLWPLLGPVTLAEFKGPTSGFRINDLPRLFTYGMQYYELHMQALAGPAELTLALLTPAETPSLLAAIDQMGWRLERLGNGYARIPGAWYSTVIAFIDEVCEAERDDYLRLFSRHRNQSREAVWWLNARRLRMTTMENVHELEGYDDFVERLLSTLTPEEVLRHYKPEERLAGLRPEERLAGLRPEEILQLLQHLQKRAGVQGELPEEVLQALRKLVDKTP